MNGSEIVGLVGDSVGNLVGSGVGLEISGLGSDDVFLGSFELEMFSEGKHDGGRFEVLIKIFACSSLSLFLEYLPISLFPVRVQISA